MVSPTPLIGGVCLVSDERSSMNGQPASPALAGNSGLTGGRLLARNTIFSIAGEVAPLALGLIAIPILVRELGVDRYGILTLSYLVVGYLSLFDLGLGRAATQQISDALGAGESERIPSIFWTSILAMFALGIGAAAIIIGMSHWLVYGILKIPPSIQAESVGVFLVLGAVLPFVLSGSCLTGTLASFQRFDLTTAVGASTGVYSLAAPLAVLVFSHNLVWIVLVLVIGRLGAWFVSLTLCIRLVPCLATNIRPSRKSLKPLLSFGGWITISGLVSPLMAYFDRFMIGSMLSIAAVSYYSVPYQIVNKLPILPLAMSGVLYPAFSATARQDPDRASILFERATRYALLALFPGVLILFFFSPEILTMFFGIAFARHGSVVTRWLLVGVLMNGLAQIPYGLVIAANRPDLTAKFHMMEVPIYFLVLFVLLRRFGVAGAAAAWTLRVTIDAIALFAAVSIILPATKAVVSQIVWLAAITVMVLGCGALLPFLEDRVVGTVAIFLIYLVVGWYRVLDRSDRAMLVDKLIGPGPKALTPS
jgi:O-antigen/teichoic acid export membrane protein